MSCCTIRIASQIMRILKRHEKLPPPYGRIFGRLIFLSKIIERDRNSRSSSSSSEEDGDANCTFERAELGARP